MPDLGPLIKTVRESRQMTVSAVAVRAKLDVGFLSQIESGRRNPSAESLSKISDALGVPKRLFLYAAGMLPRGEVDAESVDLAKTFDRIAKLESAFREKLKAL